jgi:Fur family transcriptional regulator, ferric uptake regulator
MPENRPAVERWLSGWRSLIPPARCAKIRDAMTISPDSPPLAFEDLGDAVRVLRERGLRLSTARRLVLESLFDADAPLSAERIAQHLSLDPGSVYRNLETLERHGLVRHVHLGHGAGLYTLVGRGEHEYLYCERCGAVRAVSPHELDAIRGGIHALFGYQARFTHHAIVGTCAKCSRRHAPRSKRSGRPYPETKAA